MTECLTLERIVYCNSIRTIDLLLLLLLNNSLNLSEDMRSCLPKKWELFNDLAILPSGALESKQWHDICSENEVLAKQIWHIIANSLKVSRIARQSEIANDKLRSSQVKMILGDSGEVEFVDNGVKFWLDVTKVMFSSGNVTLKKLLNRNF